MTRRALGALVVAAALLVSSVSAIYPEGHFDSVKELTTDNFDSWIQEQIDNGKTAMVRWIASPG